MARIIVREIEDDVKGAAAKACGPARPQHGSGGARYSARRPKRDRQPKSGLGTEIAGLFTGIGLKEGETISELRGFPARKASLATRNVKHFVNADIKITNPWQP